MMIVQSLRMTWRDWRAGELRFLLIALVIAVAALTSVGFFVDRMHAGLERNALQLLGADLVVSADQPISPAWKAEVQRRALTSAQTVTFPSMALAGEGEDARTQLVSLKAVSSGYPLRGSLKAAIKTDDNDGAELHDIPAAGTVWIDPNLLSGLKLGVGDSLKLGDKRFTIAKIITAEPDRGATFMNFAPRVMLSLNDLPATNLVQDGSRVTYRLLVASNAGGGGQAEVREFQQWLQSMIKVDGIRGVRLESLENGRPEMRATLDRAAVSHAGCSGGGHGGAPLHAAPH
jgi:putative ABC transport system permease protein